MTALDIPVVEPLRVRAFTPTGPMEFVGGVLVMEQFDVADVELVASRLDYDEEQVDCSNRIFQITTAMMFSPALKLAYTVFPSRRWRNLRDGAQILAAPSPEQPLLYLGNPIRLLKRGDEISVIGRGEFVIKSGVELGY